MQLVELDEVEWTSGAGDEQRRAGPLVSWMRRRPWISLASGVLAFALVVTFVAVAPRVIADREREAVLGSATFDGAVRSLAHAPRERWSTSVNPLVAPLLVGDVIVAVVDDPAEHLAGIDAVTGEVRWQLGPIGTKAAPIQSCAVVGTRVACVAGLGGRGLRPPSTLVLVDPATGTTQANHDIEGRWVEVAAAGDDVVLAGWVSDGLGVALVDPEWGAVRWRAQTSARAHPRETGNVALASAGGVVLATSFPSALVLRASDGVVLPMSEADDVVQLRADGVYVRTDFTAHDGAVLARSTFSDASGRVLRTELGDAVELGVRDPASPRSLTVDGTGTAVTMRSYTDGDEPQWTTDDGAGHPVLDVAGRIVLRRGDSLVALDASTGERKWQRPAAAAARTSVSRSGYSDGKVVAVVVSGSTTPSGLAAFRLDDGEPQWQIDLPEGTRRVVRLGTQLYVLTGDRLVALR